MTCPKCGAGQFAGATICNRCGTPLAVSGSSALPPIPAARTPFTRPIGVTVLAALDLLGGAAMLALSALWLTVATTEETATPEGVIALQSLAAISALFGLLYLAAGIGLLQLKPWGRLAQMTLAGFGLLGFPVGTLVSALILYYFTRPGVKVLFSGRGVNELSADEYNAVARDASKGAIVAVAVVGVVVLGVFAIGIVAAIAIPGLLRARMSANEASAIGQLRLMTSAQAVYSSFNKGQYGTLDCLAAPATCLPD
jgi:hypothetical protein